MTDSTSTERSPQEVAWDDLLMAAERVSRKIGVFEDGTPSDWSEWKDLREAIAAARALRSLPEDQHAGRRMVLIGYVHPDEIAAALFESGESGFGYLPVAPEAFGVMTMPIYRSEAP